MKIYSCFDPMLRTVATESRAPDNELRRTLSDMVDTMIADEGVGLAAPQVGIPERFLVMRDPDMGVVYKMINPKIISRGDKMVVMEEGCLSVTDENGTPIFADVSRPGSATVEWIDENGVAHRAEFTGYPARIVQHEYDHLDGVLFVDYLSPLKRELILRRARKKKK